MSSGGVLLFVRICLALCLMGLAGLVQAKGEAPPEATLTVANRDIVVLRATVQGVAPEMRVKRIQERIRQMGERELLLALSRLPAEVDGKKAIAFTAGDRHLLFLFESDLDPEEKHTLAQAGDQLESRLKEALQAKADFLSGPTLAKGLGWSALATLVAGIVLKGSQVLLNYLIARCRRQYDCHQGQMRWVQYGWLFVQRLTQLVLGLVWLSVTYLWAMFVLDSFPITYPLGVRLSGFLGEVFITLGSGLIGALPGLGTVAIILFLTKAVNDVVDAVFRNVDLGVTRIPGVHQDTAKATRRIVSILLWGFGVAVAYPYLPLADSEAFKGLSVMFGFMLTLGSAGIVNQWMSGLVLIYSRALRIGDFVSVGEVMGVVREMSVLSVKIINMRNEEITIPNTVLVGSPIKNYTSAGGDRGALVSTTVTIGYDTPWRQVEAMLINAAGNTEGLRREPSPFVMQKGLQDFYVEYELFAYVDKPLERIPILSRLHGNIQDEFNRHGVQIMSPHYVLQPRNSVVVPEENWFSSPAKARDR